jgi:hypothetical protein
LEIVVQWRVSKMDNRRSADRTRTSKPASIFFGRQKSEHSLDVEVTDLGNGGAGIYKPGKALLPLTFDLSFDNLRRTCRMVWRRGNFFGVIFEDQNSPGLSEPEVRGADAIFEGPAFSLLADPPQLARPDSDQTLADFASKIAQRHDPSRSDVRFTIGVLLALGLPVLISFGAYIATTVALRLG